VEENHVIEELRRYSRPFAPIRMEPITAESSVIESGHAARQSPHSASATLTQRCYIGKPRSLVAWAKQVFPFLKSHKLRI
jgi:hypothetical protein